MPAENLFQITRCETDETGGSRLVDTVMPMQSAGLVEGEAALLSTAPERAVAVTFVEVPAEARESGWHRAPCHQYVVVLSGQVEIEARDGSTRRMGPGDVILAADTEGSGHRATASGGRARLLFISLADD
ncbi:cupin domain-containing protein [Actinomadura welshii]|uniref:cupin domain-containing protein n=1 Tax=Actinomadura welshii TaxID=3103817 RepID=UPI0003AD3900|nr:cupin domain-containing protein [Actinomadura madurae]